MSRNSKTQKWLTYCTSCKGKYPLALPDFCCQLRPCFSCRYCQSEAWEVQGKEFWRRVEVLASGQKTLPQSCSSGPHESRLPSPGRMSKHNHAIRFSHSFEFLTGHLIFQPRETWWLYDVFTIFIYKQENAFNPNTHSLNVLKCLGHIL